MALKWKDKENGVDFVDANDINEIANELIDTQGRLDDAETGVGALTDKAERAAATAEASAVTASNHAGTAYRNAALAESYALSAGDDADRAVEAAEKTEDIVAEYIEDVDDLIGDGTGTGGGSSSGGGGSSDGMTLKTQNFATLEEAALFASGVVPFKCTFDGEVNAPYTSEKQSGIAIINVYFNLVDVASMEGMVAVGFTQYNTLNARTLTMVIADGAVAMKQVVFTEEPWTPVTAESVDTSGVSNVTLYYFE